MREGIVVVLREKITFPPWSVRWDIICVPLWDGNETLIQVEKEIFMSTLIREIQRNVSICVCT